MKGFMVSMGLWSEEKVLPREVALERLNISMEEEVCTEFTRTSLHHPPVYGIPPQETTPLRVHAVVPGVVVQEYSGKEVANDKDGNTVTVMGEEKGFLPLGRGERIWCHLPATYSPPPGQEGIEKEILHYLIIINF